MATGKKERILTRAELLKRGIWLTSAGEPIELISMSDTHLENCIDYISRRYRDSVKRSPVLAEEFDFMRKILVEEQDRREKQRAGEINGGPLSMHQSIMIPFDKILSGELDDTQIAFLIAEIEGRGGRPNMVDFAVAKELVNLARRQAVQVGGIPHQLEDQQDRYQAQPPLTPQAELHPWPNFFGELNLELQQTSGSADSAGSAGSAGGVFHYVQPGIYRHYKGDYYTVIGVAVNHHSPQRQEFVVYQNSLGELNVRLVEEFLSPVQNFLLWAQPVDRYTLVEPRNH